MWPVNLCFLVELLSLHCKTLLFLTLTIYIAVSCFGFATVFFIFNVSQRLGPKDKMKSMLELNVKSRTYITLKRKEETKATTNKSQWTGWYIYPMCPKWAWVKLLLLWGPKVTNLNLKVKSEECKPQVMNCNYNIEKHVWLNMQLTWK